MPVLLDNTKLADIFERLGKNINDPQATEELINILRPVLKETVNKFNTLPPEDTMQEIIMAVLKKKEFLTKAYLEGKILNPTNYIFGMFRNAALASIQKEKKHLDHLIPIDDVKVEAVAKKRNVFKTRALIKVRQETFEWLRARFAKSADYKKACKYVDIILSGKKEGSKKQPRNYKLNLYSVVFQKIKELIVKYADEFGFDVEDDSE